jgi:putative glutamine amidotransferase
MTPVVAVTAGRDGTRASGEERVGVPAAYVRALARAGLVPVLVPPLVAPAAACALLERVHGLVLTGGEDVVPARYGAAAHPRLGETDPERDAVELALIAGAVRRRLPVLAICRGLQILNVALGGTLYQDLPSGPGRSLGHDDGAERHAITIEPGSRLARVLAGTRAVVNTRHHQAVRDLAPALRATAWAEDGVVEAAEARDPGAWVLAVQWHPEEEPDDALFRGFAEALG